jgi:hypothetical protein
MDLTNFGASIFPTDTVTTITGGITTAISDNIGVILGVLAFGVGLKFVLRFFHKSVNKGI